MEDAYFAAFTPEEHQVHARLARRARAAGGAAAEARIRDDRNAAEIVVAARDRHALFANLALTISSLGGNVVGARIFTSSDSEALDVFSVQDGAGAPFGAENPRTLVRLVEALEAAGRGEAPAAAARRDPLHARPSPFNISPSVAIDNDASQAATVIEATARDRPGLLEAVARAITEEALSIQSAHIDGYGELAVDSFYVVDAQGAKLRDPGRIDAVRLRLAQALDPDDGGRRVGRLPKARASAAR
jgi:[protein-PII] uridylyltransferase